MDGKTGVSALNAIRRPVLPELPPAIQSPEIISVETTAAPVPAAEPAPPAPAAPSSPRSADRKNGDSTLGTQTPWAEVSPEDALETDPVQTLDMSDMFPPTGAEIAAMAEAEAAEKARAKGAAEAPGKSKGKKATKPSRPDLTPKGYRAGVVFRAIAQFIAALVVIGLLVGGYFMWQAVQNSSRVTELEVGQCVEDFFTPSEGEFRNVFVVGTTDCANPHAYEVFSVTNTAFDEFTEDDSTFLGIEATFARGQAYCQAEYQAFVGGDFATSPWQVWTFVPTEKRWDEGDRRVQCLVGDAAQVTPIEGSLEGTGRQ